jgi:hypothetical protein
MSVTLSSLSARKVPAMPSAFEHLIKLQNEISGRDQMDDFGLGKTADNFAHLDDMERLSFFERVGLFHVEYYGLHYDDYPLPVFETLGLPDVAPYLGSLSFRGPDVGGNGTKAWDFTPLLEREVCLSELRTLDIELSEIGRQNQVIVAGMGYEEGGQLAGWLDLAPKLRRLTTPSAPNAAFFERADHSLQWLRVDAGYDHQEFILNLSRSSCFEYLQLDFGEVSTYDRDLWEQNSTPFEHYEALFRSQTVTLLSPLIIRNPNLTGEQLAALKALRPGLGPAVIRTTLDPVNE